jgi:hypothetical protein
MTPVKVSPEPFLNAISAFLPRLPSRIGRS